VGTEEAFVAIAKEYTKYVKQYEAGSLKHYQYVDYVERLFTENGWSKPDFTKELNRRLGIEERKPRKEKPTTQLKIKYKKK
jgi:hypothetical protein